MKTISHIRIIRRDYLIFYIKLNMSPSSDSDSTDFSEMTLLFLNMVLACTFVFDNCFYLRIGFRNFFCNSYTGWFWLITDLIGLICLNDTVFLGNFNFWTLFELCFLNIVLWTFIDVIISSIVFFPSFLITFGVWMCSTLGLGLMGSLMTLVRITSLESLFFSILSLIFSVA